MTLSTLPPELKHHLLEIIASSCSPYTAPSHTVDHLLLCAQISSTFWAYYQTHRQKLLHTILLTHLGRQTSLWTQSAVVLAERYMPFHENPIEGFLIDPKKMAHYIEQTEARFRTGRGWQMENPEIRVGDLELSPRRVKSILRLWVRCRDGRAREQMAREPWKHPGMILKW